VTPEAFESRGFEVEPAALKGAAGTFDAEAEALETLARSLERHLQGLGACWGDDTVGQRFAAGYTPAEATVLGNLSSLSGGLVRIAAALRAVGESYETAEQTMVDAANSAVSDWSYA
jgi:uncharacterized protein YukE